MGKYKSIIKNILEMIVGTHDGRFHCDEVLACTMLTHYTEKFKAAKIVRSRDPKVWATCDILVDVGGKYEAPTLLDHHQIEFQSTYPNYPVRLSSAGLVYLHYPEIIPNMIQEIIEQDKAKLTFDPIINQEIVDHIRESVYKNFIIYIDANDNGINTVDGKEFVSVPSTLWARINKINPMWWDESSDEMDLFMQGIQIAREEILGEVRQILLGSIQTKGLVRKAFDRRKEYHPSGKIVVLEKYVPWQKCIVELEREDKCEGETLFVIFPVKTGDRYRIQAIALKEGCFDLRKGLKEEWRGIKDMEKLVGVSNIADIDFVHANGFIGGAISLESTIKMGELSL